MDVFAGLDLDLADLSEWSDWCPLPEEHAYKQTSGAEADLSLSEANQKVERCYKGAIPDHDVKCSTRLGSFLEDDIDGCAQQLHIPETPSDGQSLDRKASDADSLGKLEGGEVDDAFQAAELPIKRQRLDGAQAKDISKAHDAIHLYGQTCTTKAELVFRTFENLLEEVRAGHAIACRAARVVPSDDPRSAHFYMPDMMYVLKLVLDTLRMALENAGAFDRKCEEEFEQILICAKEIISGKRTKNKSPYRRTLDRVWNTLKRVFGSVGIRIRQKPPKGLCKSGQDWVHPLTLWEMPVFPGSRSKKRSSSERVGDLRPHEKKAKEWALKAWQSRTCVETEPADAGVYTLSMLSLDANAL